MSSPSCTTTLEEFQAFNEDDVAVWMTGHGLSTNWGQYAAALMDEGVDGASLINLSNEDLTTVLSDLKFKKIHILIIIREFDTMRELSRPVHRDQARISSSSSSSATQQVTASLSAVHDAKKSAKKSAPSPDHHDDDEDDESHESVFSYDFPCPAHGAGEKCECLIWLKSPVVNNDINMNSVE